jgi:tetratricopeptide (TPR) repeat protein
MIRIALTIGCWLICAWVLAQNAEILVKQSKQALEQNKIKEAINLADEAIRLEPTSAEAYNAKGLAHYAFSEYEQALGAYTKATELNPTYKEAFYNRGVCYYWLSKNEMALADFQKAIDLDKQDARSYAALGALYAKMSSLAIHQKKEAKKYFDLAEKTYQEAIRINPAYAQSYFNYASLIAENKPKKALEYLQTYQQSKPNDVEALVLMGILYNLLKQYEQSLAVLEKAINLNSNHSEAFLELAWANFQLKNKTEACKNWHKAENLGNTTASEFLKKYCK